VRHGPRPPSTVEFTMVRGLLLAAGLVGLSLAATAQDKDKDKAEAKLVGKWKLTKSGDDLPKELEAMIEFVKDGKVKVSIKFGEKPDVMEGTWKVKDEKKIELTMKLEGKDKTETIDILKLDDKVLHTKDDKGKVDEFERVKDEKK
jgi:uncharacterized protein (TIGR03066 family)